MSDLFDQTSEHSFAQPSMHRALAVEAARLVSGLAEPAAPTVTREQADRFVMFLRHNGTMGTSDCPARELSGVSEVPIKDRCWACQIGVDEVIVTKDGLDNWPAFFRAVADALEGE